MSFFGRSGHSRASGDAPFSIDDAFDIPEDDVEAGESAPAAPIVRDGRLRLSSENGRASYAPNGDTAAAANGGLGGGGSGEAGSTDSASLIQSGSGGGGGYYEGPPPLKYWWMHPKIKNNVRVVVAACLLVILGLGLIACGAAVYCIPSFKGIQGVVFIIAGIICFVPGAYHIGYIYLAVKGKRGFEFSHLPLFNN